MKRKTNWSYLGEVIFFIVSTFVCVFGFCALNAWVQLEVNALAEAFLLISGTLVVAWIYFSVQAVKIFLID